MGAKQSLEDVAPAGGGRKARGSRAVYDLSRPSFFSSDSALLESPTGRSSPCPLPLFREDDAASHLNSMPGGCDAQHRHQDCCVGALEGLRWAFNPAPPTDPILRSQLESFYPNGLAGYSAFVRRLNNMRTSSGLDSQADPSARRARVEAAVREENFQLPSNVVWEVCTHPSSVEGNYAENTAPNEEWAEAPGPAFAGQITLFMVFDLVNFVDERAVLADAVPSARHCQEAGEGLQQLQTLLDAGVISQADFNGKKAQFLKEWNRICHQTYVNYNAGLDVAGCVI